MGSSGPPAPSRPSGATWSSSPCLAAPSSSPILTTEQGLCVLFLEPELGFPLQPRMFMPRAVQLAAPLLAKSEVLAASLSPVAAAGASHYGGGPAGLAQSDKQLEGLRGAGRGGELHRGPRRGRM